MKNYYLIGIKGTGMAALACMLKDLGNEVSGSDLEKHFFTEDGLVERNIPIYSFSPDNIQDNMDIIVGNAFLDDFPEVQAAHANDTCTVKRYHEFVGEFIKPYHSIAIAGSHGKTTTTGLVSSMMKMKDPNTGWLIGDGEGNISEKTQCFCLEADEFRRHFLAYHPEYAIITNVDIDHVDYFKDKADYRSAYEVFATQVSKALVVYGEDAEARLCNFGDTTHYWYGLEENDDFQAKNVEETSSGIAYDLYFNKEFVYHFHFPLIGHHLVLNTIATVAIGILEGIKPEDIEEGISNFHGVKRRFVVDEREDGNIYIDDYAHHPTEVGVTVDAARLKYPDQKLVAVFKPHRASRVLFFADDFAKQLSKADKVYLLDFTSIDDKQDGTDIDITYLQKKIPGSVVLSEDEEGAKLLSKEKKAVFLFMSSKDIYWLADLVKNMD